jgi:hypothetical protein
LIIPALLIGASALAAPPPSGLQKPAIAQSCTEYIDRGLWVYRYSEWTLSLRPSDCGRQIDESETGLMFYEIVKKFSGSRFWQNDRGMINQLTCHLVIARMKAEWNLDPWRPYVGHNNTVAQECNVTVPDPDPPFH